jgi:hypothetical protein
MITPMRRVFMVFAPALIVSRALFPQAPGFACRMQIIAPVSKGAHSASG